MWFQHVSTTQQPLTCEACSSISRVLMPRESQQTFTLYLPPTVAKCWEIDGKIMVKTTCLLEVSCFPQEFLDRKSYRSCSLPKQDETGVVSSSFQPRAFSPVPGKWDVQCLPNVSPVILQDVDVRSIWPKQYNIYGKSLRICSRISLEHQQNHLQVPVGWIGFIPQNQLK